MIEAGEIVADLEARLDWHLRNMPYSEYLLTAHWRHMRTVALEYYGGSCAFCGGDSHLHVHHRNEEAYDRRGCERLADLTLLCSDCHGKGHLKAAA